MKTNFAKNMVAMRKEMGLTQEQLADNCQMTRAAIGAYEEGRNEPSLYKLTIICRELGTSPTAIILGRYFDTQ